MIKFFRHIRQQLIMENKTGKPTYRTGRYFKYAIGEIVLVVIGILIALQINNWNEKRKDLSKSKDYLVEFKNDLTTDVIRISKGIADMDTLIRADKWVLHKTEYAATDIDSILLAMGDDYHDIEINERTFNTIQNSGNSKLTGYDSLFKKLSHYYIQKNKRMKAHTEWDEKEVTDGQEYMKDLKQTIEKNNNFIKDAIRTQDESQFPMITDTQEQAKLIMSFATSVQGRNHFKDNYVRHVRVKGVFAEVIEEAKMIMDLIDLEIAKEGK
jgi:hypothetical protein